MLSLTRKRRFASSWAVDATADHQRSYTGGHFLVLPNSKRGPTTRLLAACDDGASFLEAAAGRTASTSLSACAADASALEGLDEPTACFAAAAGKGGALVLATCSTRGVLRWWAAAASGASGKPSLRLKRTVVSGHRAAVQAMDFHPSGALLATAGSDGMVKVWDAEHGYCTHSHHSHTGVVARVSWG